jgi:glycine/D-amino acid oxidase-like deaminating enzyme
VPPSRRLVDVAIVGAGYTGLWTAYYLSRADPSLRLAVVEAELAGFGASGRNGGWCSALYPVSLTRLAAERGRDAAVRQYRTMQAAVAEVGRVIADERLAADWAHGGTVTLARNPAQLARARAEVAEARGFGFGEDDLRLLSAAEASARIAATGVLGGLYTPHCAALHPAKLPAHWPPGWPSRCRSTNGRRRWPSSPAGYALDSVTCGPRWWSGPPRASPPGCPAPAGRWRRCTR